MMVNIGYGNLVAASKIDAIVKNEGAAIRRYRTRLKDSSDLIDASSGHKARSLVVTDTHIYLSAISAEALERRVKEI